LISLLAGCTAGGGLGGGVGTLSQRYARAVLDHADLAEANPLLEHDGALSTRSEVGFLKGHGDLHYAAKDETHYVINKLVVAGQSYTGDFTVELAPGGSKIRRSTLQLKRADGQTLSL
jgi:hypothetical protein